MADKCSSVLGVWDITKNFGEKAVKLLPGDPVTIPADVKHWHGASQDSWFSHLAFKIPGEKQTHSGMKPYQMIIT
ncbi:hypothetical protein [Streptococcus mitis]|uniref:hypothetical protein n=1 Tax=Streptococcus mitis TaxID=28037 RepID=UPI001C4FDB95